MSPRAAHALALEAEPAPMRAQPAWLRRLGERDGHGRAALALLIAAVVHAGMVASALHAPTPPAAITAVTEVELAPAPPPPPPEPEAPPPEAPKELAPAARAPRSHKAAPAPIPAAAAPLRTLDEDVKTADEPVRFVTDPNGTAFGYGTVARGGSGTGAPGAQLAHGPELADAAGHGSAPELSRPPSLGELDPCRGFFPPRAQADRGEVQLKVRVEADGKVRSVNLARESPTGQGFGAAARECLLSKRFSPALDKAGQPVAVVSPVTIRFSR